MPRFLPDTSCLVAALCAWHVHHRQAAREIDGRISAGETMVVAAPTLIESYAVLTRLPPPHRLSPDQVVALLEGNFLGPEVEAVTLTVVEYRRLVREGPARGLAGGRTYDAVIVACAVAARVDALLTFNERQFRPLADNRIPVVVPA